MQFCGTYGPLGQTLCCSRIVWSSHMIIITFWVIKISPSKRNIDFSDSQNSMNRLNADVVRSTWCLAVCEAYLFGIKCILWKLEITCYEFNFDCCLQTFQVHHTAIWPLLASKKTFYLMHLIYSYLSFIDCMTGAGRNCTVFFELMFSIFHTSFGL